MNRTPFFRFVSIVALVAFLVNSPGSVPFVHAQDLRLPVPGVMVSLSPPENPPVLRGVTVFPDNPFRFDFILDKGSDTAEMQQEQLKQESAKLVRYFLASMTTPENDLWVNLSPYEKNRVIPQSFGLTDMGRDLLGEDYILKQITASLIYPEGETGKRFWKRVYESAAKKFGTTNIPVNTFNKVWIVPDHAKVYEHGNTAFVIHARLKVMLEEDYLSLQKHAVAQNNTASLGADVVREVIIPELEREVNEGKSFAPLRQVYYSLILATWFKERMKDSILGRKYMDQNKVTGIHYEHSLLSVEGSKDDAEAIYQRYLKAFKKGVYNYIKEEQDPMSMEMVPRKYFSGGIVGAFKPGAIDYAQTVGISELPVSDYAQVAVNLDNSQSAPDSAMINFKVKKTILFTAAYILAFGLYILYDHKQGKDDQPADQPVVSYDLSTLKTGINRLHIIPPGQAVIKVPNGEYQTGPIESFECVGMFMFDRKIGRMSMAHVFYEENKNNKEIRKAVDNFLRLTKATNSDVVNLVYLHRFIASQVVENELRGRVHINVLDVNAFQDSQTIEEVIDTKDGDSVLQVMDSIWPGAKIQKYKLNKEGKLVLMKDNSMTSRRSTQIRHNTQLNQSVMSVDRPSGPGGIDLTAKRMDLDVDIDKTAISQPMDIKALENIQIKGLYIKDIEIKTLNNLPQILGISSSAPGN